VEGWQGIYTFNGTVDTPASKTEGGSMLLQFVRNAYRVCTTIVLWIVLIASGGIGGYIFGNMFGFLGHSAVLTTAVVILGVALGGAVGILFIVLFFGAVAIIINMDKNIAEQNKLLAQLVTQLSAPQSTKSPTTLPDYGHTTGIPPVKQEMAIYTAITKSLLKASPEPNGQTRKVLNAGETVSFIRRSGDNPKWFYAKTFDSTEGWCFTGHFRRLTNG
jgi:hypothetical protein